MISGLFAVLTIDLLFVFHYISWCLMISNSFADQDCPRGKWTRECDSWETRGVCRSKANTYSTLRTKKKSKYFAKHMFVCKWQVARDRSFVTPKNWKFPYDNCKASNQ